MVTTSETNKICTSRIVKFIDLGYKLKKLKNFLGSLAIVSGLTSFSVYRLKTAWKSVPSSSITTFQDLEELCSPLKNFENVRKEMRISVPPFIVPPCILIDVSYISCIYERFYNDCRAIRLSA